MAVPRTSVERRYAPLTVRAARDATRLAVIAYYRALARGPVSVVTPVFGMFIVTSSLLRIVFLGGSFSFRKGAGIVFVALAVYLIAG